MATRRVTVFGDPTMHLDSGVFFDKVSNQITAAAAPSVGELIALWVADAGADEGFYLSFKVPKNYVGSPKLVVTALLDGAPGASDTLGWGFRKRAVANNEALDGAFDTEQTVSATIGSSGSGHSDEDMIEQSITLTAGDYAVDDIVLGYCYIDATGTSYGGNCGVLKVEFEFTDA